MVLTVPRIQLDAMQFSLADQEKTLWKTDTFYAAAAAALLKWKNTLMSDKNFTCVVLFYFLFSFFHTCVLCLPSPTANNRVQSSRSQFFRECLGTSQWESSFAGSSEIRFDQLAELQPRSSRKKDWPRGTRAQMEENDTRRGFMLSTTTRNKFVSISIKDLWLL